MGLLSFSKKSRKQEQRNHASPKQVFALAPHSPPLVENSHTSLIPFLGPSDKKVDSSVPIGPEMSLMDDIMNELDSVKSINKPSGTAKQPTSKRVSQNKLSPPFLSFDPPKTSSPSEIIGLVVPAPVSPASMPSEYQQYIAARNMQQQRPRPLINFSNRNNSESNLQRDNLMLNSDDTDSYLSDADNELIAPRSAMRQPINRNSTQAELLNISVINGKKSITPPPLPPTTSALNNIKSSPPASTLATGNPAGVSLLDRMKERHRQEVRRSLNNSPFLENQNTTKSSPSMPLIFAADDSSPLSSTRPLVQSQSFTSNALSPFVPVTKRSPGNLIRSTSAVNDIHGSTTTGTMPNQTQSEINLIQRYSAPSQTRNSQAVSTTRSGYFQNGAMYTSAPYQAQESPMGISEEVYPIKQSVSAYSGFPQQSLLQQQFQNQQQQIAMQQQIQQQQQQQQLQQKIQQQIEQQQMQQQLEQQKIQYQLDQKQLQLQEQHRIQQYQLQQLKIHQQHQHYINQAILEKPLIRRDSLPKEIVTELNKDIKPLKSRPLYERLSCPTVYDQQHKTDQIAVPDTPPPESQQHSSDDSIPKDTIFSNSSTSTLTESPPKLVFKPKEKTIKLPNKIKRELQGMQLRRSPYSLPDLSMLSNAESEQGETDDIINWSTIQIFNYPGISNNEETCYTPEDITAAIDCYPKLVRCCPIQEQRHSCLKRHHCTQPSSCNIIKNHDYSIDLPSCHYKKHHNKHRHHHRCQKRDLYSKPVQA